MTAQVQRLIANTQQLQMESSAYDRDAVDRMRQDQIDKKRESLTGRNEASNIRGDAQDTSTAGQAGSAAIGAAAAIGTAACVAASIPIVGAIIAAIAAVIVAVILIAVHLENQGKEREAAMLDKQAGLQEVQAEKLDAEIDDKQDASREAREKLANDIQQFLQYESESRREDKEALA